MRFLSKRNEVLLKNGFVYKHTKNSEAAALEAAILRHLRGKGVAVPKVLTCEGSLLVMECLPGEPLPNIIERGAYDPVALAWALCDWFAGFYDSVSAGEVRGDVNGRNFLYDGEKAYSVDFEERCHGPIARDAGRLAAFLATYDTCDHERQTALGKTFLQEFSERFTCELTEIMKEREIEYAAMLKRRQSVDTHKD